mmetsp:Transcript_9020/g.31853  ORF Transcript_9020/g.31853 Transcript_9020/m.31853 type:complete len:444 (+) Transcript_9020:245-1576(+)
MRSTYSGACGSIWRSALMNSSLRRWRMAPRWPTTLISPVGAASSSSAFVSASPSVPDDTSPPAAPASAVGVSPPSASPSSAADAVSLAASPLAPPFLPLRRTLSGWPVLPTSAWSPASSSTLTWPSLSEWSPLRMSTTMLRSAMTRSHTERDTKASLERADWSSSPATSCISTGTRQYTPNGTALTASVRSALMMRRGSAPRRPRCCVISFIMRVTTAGVSFSCCLTTSALAPPILPSAASRSRRAFLSASRFSRRSVRFCSFSFDASTSVVDLSQYARVFLFSSSSESELDDDDDDIESHSTEPSESLPSPLGSFGAFLAFLAFFDESLELPEPSESESDDDELLELLLELEELLLSALAAFFFLRGDLAFCVSAAAAFSSSSSAARGLARYAAICSSYSLLFLPTCMRVLLNDLEFVLLIFFTSCFVNEAHRSSSSTTARM